MAQPSRYLFELSGRAAPRASPRDFLIRAYPRQHVAELSKRLFKTPEYCAACHKQFIDQEVNNVGWVQLQNQYDNWRKSRWNHPGDAAQDDRVPRVPHAARGLARSGGGRRARLQPLRRPTARTAAIASSARTR